MTARRPTLQQTSQLLDLLETVTADEEVRDPQVLRAHLAQVCQDQGIATTPERLDQAVSRYVTTLSAVPLPPAPPQMADLAKSRIVSRGLLWWPRPHNSAEQEKVIRQHRRLQNASWRVWPARAANDLMGCLVGWMGFSLLLSLFGHPGMGAAGSVAFLCGAMLTRLALWWGGSTQALRWSLRPARQAFEKQWMVSLSALGEKASPEAGFEANADRMWAPYTPTAEELSRWIQHPDMRATLARLREGHLPFTRRDAYFMNELFAHPDAWTATVEEQRRVYNARIRGRSCK